MRYTTATPPRTTAPNDGRREATTRKERHGRVCHLTFGCALCPGLVWTERRRGVVDTFWLEGDPRIDPLAFREATVELLCRNFGRFLELVAPTA